MKKLLLIFIILGILALPCGFALGWFGTDSEDTDEVAQETESTSESLTEQDEETEPIVEDDEKEEVLEKEDTYADEDKYSLAAMEEGLIAYFPFDEDILDYSGEDVGTTNHNAYFVDGKDGEALQFNGTNSYVEALVDINPIPMPQMTMAVWVKAKPGSVVVRQVIGNDNDDYDRSIDTDFRGGGKGWSCFAGDGKVLGYEVIVADKWTFVAAVYDQSAGTVKLFVDGSIYEKDGKMVSSGNDFVLIGARGSIENSGHYFNGAIDEVKIYDYALSDTELNSLYTTGVAKPVTE